MKKFFIDIIYIAIVSLIVINFIMLFISIVETDKLKQEMDTYIETMQYNDNKLNDKQNELSSRIDKLYRIQQADFELIKEGWK